MVRHVKFVHIIYISMAIKNSLKHYLIFWFYKIREKKRWITKKVLIYLDYYWAFCEFLKFVNNYCNIYLRVLYGLINKLRNEWHVCNYWSQGQNGTASINVLACGDWLISSGKHEVWERARPGRIGRKEFPEIVFLFAQPVCSSPANSVTSKRPPNRTIFIPLEPAWTQDREYASDFIQKLTHSTNRTKERIASKLQSKITQPIRNENTIYKLIRDLQWVFYKIPMLIEAIASFEIPP